jgi:hypothetical protein
MLKMILPNRRLTEKNSNNSPILDLNARFIHHLSDFIKTITSFSNT